MKAIIAVLVAVLLGAVGLGVVAVGQHRTIQELERSQEQASTEIEAIAGEVSSLNNAPDPTDFAADIAALQDSSDKLTDKVARLPGWSALEGLAETVDDNYAYFDECVTDLLDLSNGDFLSDGLVC